MPYDWKSLYPLPTDCVDVLKRKKKALERVFKVKIVQLAQIGAVELAQRPQNEEAAGQISEPKAPRTAPSDGVQSVSQALRCGVSLLRVPAQDGNVDYTTPVARRLPAPGLAAPSSSGVPGECWSTEVPSQPPATHQQSSKARGSLGGELPAALARQPSRYKPLPFRQPPDANPDGTSDKQSQAVHALEKPAEEGAAKQGREKGQSPTEESHGAADVSKCTGGKPEGLQQRGLTDPLGAMRKRETDPFRSVCKGSRKEGPAQSEPLQKRSRLSTVTAATGQLDNFDVGYAKKQLEAPSMGENAPPSPKWQKRKAFRPAPQQQRIKLRLAAEKPARGVFVTDRKSSSDPVKQQKLSNEALTERSEERRRFGGLAIGRSQAGRAAPLLAAAAQQEPDRPLLTPALPAASGSLRRRRSADVGNRDIKDDPAAAVDTLVAPICSPHGRHESPESHTLVRLGENDETPADLEPTLVDGGAADQTAESTGEEGACPTDLQQSQGSPMDDAQQAALSQMCGGVACQLADVVESTQVADVPDDHGDATQPLSATATPSIALALPETEASPAIGARMPCEGTVVEDTPPAAENGYESDDRSSDSMGPSSAGWAHAVGATPHSRLEDGNVRVDVERGLEDSAFNGRRKHLPDLGTVIAETPQASADAHLGSEQLNSGVCEGATVVRKELWKLKDSDESSQGGKLGEGEREGSHLGSEDDRRDAVLEQQSDAQEPHTRTVSFEEEEKGKAPATESREEAPEGLATALLLEFNVQVFAAATSSDGRAVAICVGSAVPETWELQVWHLKPSAPCMLEICSVPAETLAPDQFLQLFKAREGRLVACKLWGSRAAGEWAAVSLLQVSGGRSHFSEVPVGFECGALLATRSSGELLIAGRGKRLACLEGVGTDDGSVSMAPAAACNIEAGAESVSPLVIFLAESADGGTVAGALADGSICIWNRDRQQPLAQHSLPSCSVLRALPVERHTAGNGAPLTTLLALTSGEAAGGKRQAGLLLGAVAGTETMATEQVTSCQEVVHLAISPEGLVAAAESSGVIRVWSLAEEACPAILPHFCGRTIFSLSLSAKEEAAGQLRLVAVTSDGAVLSCAVQGQ